MLCQFQQQNPPSFGTFIFLIFIFSLINACTTDEDWEKIDLNDRINDADLQRIQPLSEPHVMRFGFEPSGSFEEDARQLQPLLAYLSKKTGLPFELSFMRQNGEIIHALGTGKIQFAVMGALSYLKARRLYGVVPVVRGLNEKNLPQYRAVIATTPNSGINTLADIRGKRFAFGPSTSTQGYLIPRIILYEHGIAPEDLSTYFFARSHRECANAILAGIADAGGLQDKTAFEYAENGMLKIIYVSRPYPSGGIVANKNVPHEIIAKVKHALLDFKPLGSDSTNLYHWEKTAMSHGFSEAHDNDYRSLRNWARKFGLLDDKKPRG